MTAAAAPLEAGAAWVSARAPARPGPKGPIVGIVDALWPHQGAIGYPALYAAVKETASNEAIIAALELLWRAGVVERTAGDRFRLTARARRGMR